MRKMGIRPNCPLCRAVYRGQDLKLVREVKGRYLFHILCPGCHASIINITMDNLIGVSSLYMVTDFSREDLVKFVDSSPVLCDEVIETYEQLTADSLSGPFSPEAKNLKQQLRR